MLLGAEWGEPIPVRGAVCFDRRGATQAMGAAQAAERAVFVPASARWPEGARHALSIADAHCDHDYSTDSLLICVDRAALHRPFADGDRVIARIGGGRLAIALCMRLEMLPLGDFILSTATNDSRLRERRQIRADPPDLSGFSGETAAAFVHAGEPTAADYNSDEPVAIDALVFGHVE